MPLNAPYSIIHLMRIEALNVLNWFPFNSVSQPILIISAVALAALALLGAAYCNRRKNEDHRLLENDLELAVRCGRLDEVKDLISRHRSLIDYVKGSKGRTPTIFCDAVLHNQREIAAFLLEKGANINAHSRGGTAVAVAIFNGNLSMLNWLLDLGANPDLGAQSTPPLLLALSLRHDNPIEMAETLVLHGASLSFPDHLNSPLYLAALVHLKERPAETTGLIKLMLEKGAQLTPDEERSELGRKIKRIGN